MINKKAKWCLDLNKLNFTQKQKLMDYENKTLKIGYQYKTAYGQCTKEYMQKNNLIEVDFNTWINS